MIILCRCGNKVPLSEDARREGMCWCDACGALINVAEAPKLRPKRKASRPDGPAPRPASPGKAGPQGQPKPRPRQGGHPQQPPAERPSSPQPHQPKPRRRRPVQAPPPAVEPIPVQPAAATPPQHRARPAARPQSQSRSRSAPVVAQGIGGPTTKRPDPRRRAPHPMLAMFIMLAALATLVMLLGGSNDVDADNHGIGSDLAPGQIELVAHWKLDGSPRDAGPYGIHGKLVGNPKPVSGRIGKALEFDGKNRMEIDHHHAFDTLAGAMTVSAWVKLPNKQQADWAGIVTKGDSTWRLSLAAGQRGQFHFSINRGSPNNNANSKSTSYHDNKWRHVVGVYNGTSVDLYVDGKLAGSNTTVNPSIHHGSQAVWISGNAEKSGREIIGVIDDVRLYRGAMTLEQVRDLHRSGG